MILLIKFVKPVSKVIQLWVEYASNHKFKTSLMLVVILLKMVFVLNVQLDIILIRIGTAG